jgi:peptidyl-prolyl cis-trans isomerase D
VKNATTPPFDATSIEAKAAAEQMKPAFVNDILEQYVGALEKIYNVSINQKALEAATGGDQNQ